MNADPASAWGAHADTYAATFAPLTGYIAESMLRMVGARLPAGAAVLDVACGTGALAIPAAERAARLGGTVVASDFAPGMVDHTRRAAVARGIPEATLRCEIQDGEALTYADASFDGVFSAFGIFLFGDRRAGWREAARVLRPGGVFATTVWQGPATNPMLRAQMGPMMRAMPARLLGPPSGGWIEVAEADALIAEVTACAPLVDVRCRPFRASHAVVSGRVAWEAMRHNPVIGPLLGQCTPDEVASIEASVLDGFRELSGGDDQPLLFESVCNVLVATRG